MEKANLRNGGKMLRVSVQASRDGSKKMPLTHRKAGEYRELQKFIAVCSLAEMVLSN